MRNLLRYITGLFRRPPKTRLYKIRSGDIKQTSDGHVVTGASAQQFGVFTHFEIRDDNGTLLSHGPLNPPP